MYIGFLRVWVSWILMFWCQKQNKCCCYFYYYQLLLSVPPTTALFKLVREQTELKLNLQDTCFLKKHISRYVSPVSTACISLVILAPSQTLSAENWAISTKLLMDVLLYINRIQQKSNTWKHMYCKILHFLIFLLKYPLISRKKWSYLLSLSVYWMAQINTW